MKVLIEYLVKSLVDHPEQVAVAEREDDGNVMLELKVADDDLGKVIGKSGFTINAIRAVLQAAASSRKKRARLDIIS